MTDQEFWQLVAEFLAAGASDASIGGDPAVAGISDAGTAAVPSDETDAEDPRFSETGIGGVWNEHPAAYDTSPSAVGYYVPTAQRMKMEDLLRQVQNGVAQAQTHTNRPPSNLPIVRSDAPPPQQVAYPSTNVVRMFPESRDPRRDEIFAQLQYGGEQHQAHPNMVPGAQIDYSPSYQPQPIPAPTAGPVELAYHPRVMNQAPAPYGYANAGPVRTGSAPSQAQRVVRTLTRPAAPAPAPSHFIPAASYQPVPVARPMPAAATGSRRVLR